MDPIGRVVLGMMGLFVLWTVVRAMRTGVIYSRGVEFNADEQPIIYALGLLVHAIIAAIFGWCAAGYDPQVLIAFLMNGRSG